MRLISNEELAIVAGGESTTSRENDGPAQDASIELDRWNEASCTPTENGGLECVGDMSVGRPDDFWIVGGNTCIRVVEGEVVFIDSNPN